MRGWTAYVVYRPGMNAAVLANVSKITPVDRLMIDVESWGGQIVGDHSDEINSLADSLANVVGSQDRVWIYGNGYDLGTIAPRRRPWLQVVAAAWGDNKPVVANMIGWQYTEGQHVSGNRPRASAPFGYCDHNELYVDELSGQGGGTPIEVPAEDDEGDDSMPRQIWFDTDGNGTGDACFLVYDNGVMVGLSGGDQPGILAGGGKGYTAINGPANPVNKPTYDSMRAVSNAILGKGAP